MTGSARGDGPPATRADGQETIDASLSSRDDHVHDRRSRGTPALEPARAGVADVSAALSAERLGPHVSGSHAIEQRLRSAQADDASEALVRVQVGRFTILRKLGAGGMGVVFEAHDAELDRKVAIKLLHRRIETRARPRILREARAMAKVSHPNVVQVFEIGEYDDQLFIAMEFVVGKTLRSWQEARAGRGWREVLGLYLQVGRGLAAVHDKGLIHRDFKPDNVLVGEDGRARVLDFGLAGLSALDLDVEDARTLVDAAEHELTRAGARLGTPRYMSPEQHLGLPADARSDQFSYS